MSRDGTRVAFEQDSPQFGFGMTGSAQVFVRDLAAATTRLASRTPGGAVADDAEQPSLSADGNRVSFTTNFDRSPLTPQVFVRDLNAGTTTPVSVGRDGGGPARLGASESSISGNGGCVAFSSSSDDLVNPSYGPDFQHVFLRGLAAGCSVGISDSGAGGGLAAAVTVGGGPKPDKTPPRIFGARLTHARFSVTNARTARRRDRTHAASRTPRHELRVLPLRERDDDDRDHPPHRWKAQRRPLREAAAATGAPVHADRHSAHAHPPQHAAGPSQRPLQRTRRRDHADAWPLRGADRRARPRRESL